jgi:phospholipase C
MTFDRAAEALGFGVYVDTRVVSPHHTEAWVDDKTFDKFVATNEQTRQQVKEVDHDG